MRGRALQKAGKLADAAHAYTQAFEKLAPAGAARPGEESHGPTQYGFFAGMQAANLLAQLKRYDDADAAYQRVAEHYPKADKLADVLFDWANVLYVAKKDASQKQRIRDLLSRIERDFPASAAQPKARLFLAELDAQGGQAASADKMLRGLVSDNAADAKTPGRTRWPGSSRWLARSNSGRPSASCRKNISRNSPRGPTCRVVRLQGASADLRLNNAPAAEKTLADLLRELKADGSQAAPGGPTSGSCSPNRSISSGSTTRSKPPSRICTLRMPDSPLLPQADEVLGRSFKNRTQWDKATAAFQKAIDGSHGEQNDTAAKSQLMIAEIRFLQKDFRHAKEEYLKVSTLYDRLPEWAAPALFQVGQCEEELQQTRDAEKTYTSLIASFPRSDFAKDAQKRLDELHKRPAG